MLQTLGVLAGLSVLCLAPPAADNQPPEAKAILDAGIKSLGGADKLGKLPATTFKSQGYLLFGKLRIQSQSQWSVQYPDKYRYDGKITIDDSTPIGHLIIANGKQGWGKSEIMTSADLAAGELTIAQQDTRAVHLAHRLVPLAEQEYELSPLGELKIDNRPAVGIKIAQKNQPDLDVYFDKETHLPIKVSFRCKETNDAEPVPHSFSLGEYKETDGVRHFTKIKMYREDKLLLEMNLSEVKRLEKVDANLFEKP